MKRLIKYFTNFVNFFFIGCRWKCKLTCCGGCCWAADADCLRITRMLSAGGLTTSFSFNSTGFSVFWNIYNEKIYFKDLSYTSRILGVLNTAEFVQITSHSCRNHNYCLIHYFFYWFSVWNCRIKFQFAVVKLKPVNTTNVNIALTNIFSFFSLLAEFDLVHSASFAATAQYLTCRTPAGPWLAEQEQRS